jgi:geranylgeranyl pyrophosphate synthase
MKKNLPKQEIQKILKTHGAKTSEKATNALLQDPTLKTLKAELEFVSTHWNDPLRPALIKLACQAVGGKPEQTEKVAIATSLMNLSFYLWDDIIDKSPSRLFKPTLSGKFGEPTALIIGGIASAKAYTILNQTQLDNPTRQKITKLIWTMWANIAQAETQNIQARTSTYTAEDKMKKIEKEAQANMETCLKLGAIIGNASQTEVNHLGKYGLYLGIALELQNDVRVAMNLTLELSDKIKSGNLPFTLLWAKEHSNDLEGKLDNLRTNKTISQKEIHTVIKGILETDALNAIKETVETVTRKSVEEISQIKKNSASKALWKLVQIQPQLLFESLPFFSRN